MRYPGKCFAFLALLLSTLLIPLISDAQEFASIVKSADTFVKTLSPDQLKKTQYNFNDSLRFKWTNLPVGMVPRPGIQYGELSDNSRIAFQEMLGTFLTSQGYLKVSGIMMLDDILNVLYQTAFDKGQINTETFDMIKNLKWKYENYFVSIWGTPNEKDPWGFSLGGHHLALNLTMRGKQIAFTPLFIGTDPSQVKTGKYAGWRVLSKEEDYGFALLNFLTPKQKEKAILSQETPKDIITNPKSSQRITAYYGIAAKEFNADQMAVFKILIQEYLHNFEHSVAHGLFEKIEKSGYDKIYFAWIGGKERNTPHYYIINGPDFLVEYDNVGFQDDGNHIHAILRQKDNDFGADILKDHYLTSDHHKK